MSRICPLLNKKCLESKCVAWVEDIVEENGIAKARSACVEFFWKPLLLKAIANRADGTQRAVEGFRNETHTANKAFGALLSLKPTKSQLEYKEDERGP